MLPAQQPAILVFWLVFGGQEVESKVGGGGVALTALST